MIKEMVFDGKRVFVEYKEDNGALYSPLPRPLPFQTGTILDLTSLKTLKNVHGAIKDLTEEEANEIRESTEEYLILSNHVRVNPTETEINSGYGSAPKIVKKAGKNGYAFIKVEEYKTAYDMIKDSNSSMEDWEINNYIILAVKSFEKKNS